MPKRYSTDIEGGWLHQRRNPPRTDKDDGPTETFEERVERERRYQLWGAQEKLPRQRSSKLR